MNDRNSRLPVPAKAALPVRRTASTPALWQQAAPVVVRGAALVAVGFIGEWLIRSAARRALNGTPPSGKNPRKRQSLVTRNETPAEGIIAVSETVVMTRRVVVRR
jgi:hypothetical protein